MAKNEKDLLGVLVGKEDVYGGSTNSNDPYATYTLNEFLGVTMSMCDCIDLLASTKLDEDIDIKDLVNETKDRYLNEAPLVSDINGAVKFVSSINANGTFKNLKLHCPVCGKEVDVIPKAGFCSTECGLKFLTSKIIALVPTQKGQQNSISKKFKIILDYINIAVNLSTILPGIVIHISTLSDTYRKLLSVLINKAFLKLKLVVNKILIWKNKLIEKILKWITSGTISQYIEMLFMWLKVFLTTLNLLKTTFNAAYSVAMAALQLIAKIYGLPGEYMGFLAGFYPRAIIHHPGKLLIDLPVKTLNLKQSAFENVNIDLIENLILGVFPPITAPEYFITPEAFKVRVLFSDQNISVIKPIITTIERIAKMGAEFLPSYENLKFTNVWFLIAMIFGWGPTTQSIYGAIA